MKRLSLLLLLLLSSFAGSVLLRAQESRPAPEAAKATISPTEELSRHLEALCSVEHAGRSGAGAEVTRRYLAGEFTKLGLKPLSGERFDQPFASSGLKGVNLAGKLSAGAEKKLPGYLILSAHYDHLGRRGQATYRGACDNASGVAAMLEILRRIDPKTLHRDLVVVAFDLEERGLLGSTAWCERPPLPLADCHLFITMDMLGRKGLGIVDDLLFAQGWEWTPEILTDLEAAALGTDLDLACFWTDIAGDRSDFVAFKKKRVPHLFFSTGENEDYHQPTDLPEKIDIDLLQRQSLLVEGLLVAAAARPDALEYRQAPLKHLIEFVSLRKLASALMRTDHPRLTVGTRAQALLLYGFAAKVLARGEVTDQDRATLRRIAGQLQSEMR